MLSNSRPRPIAADAKMNHNILGTYMRHSFVPAIALLLFASCAHATEFVTIARLDQILILNRYLPDANFLTNSPVLGSHNA